MEKGKGRMWQGCRKILLAVLTLAVLAAGNLNGNISEVRAADGGYTISNFVVDARVNENAVLDITEQIHVNFTEAKHGIYRDIPLRLKVNREVAGKTKSFLYRVKISDIRVEGSKYDLDTEDGCQRIILGDEDVKVTGNQTYTIRYRLDFGDDRISEYDELFYNLVGDGWQVPVEHVNYRVTFEKETDLSGLHVYVGKFKDKAESRADTVVDGNTVQGSVADGLNPREAVTLFVRLPEGYFTGARTESPVPVQILTGLLALLALYSIVRYFRKYRKKTVTETVEFYPPEDLSSAEVGYVIDGRADQKDIISLIFWLAHRGYLSISGEDKEDLVLHKRKDLPPEMPQHIQIFFHGLFRKKNDLRVSKISRKSAEAVQKAQTALPAYFFGERKLSNEKVAGLSIVLCILAGILTGTGAGAAGGFLSEMSIVLTAVTAILLIVFSLVLVSLEGNGAFTKKRTLLTAKAAILVLAGAGCLAGMSMALFRWYVPVIYTCGVIAIWAAAATQSPTEYKLMLTGRLLGFRNFIEKAELDRLNLLIKDNPSYFYDVLPYAYVFGLTDKWAEKFESIAMDVPEWWMGPTLMPSYTAIYLAHSMQHCMDQVSHQVYQAAAPDSKTFTSSSGGYSGGGFGGGGGGSW